MVFPRSKPHATSDHLLIKGADFGRTQDHDAVHGRAVPAFGEQHGIAKHVISARLEIGKHLRAVIAIADSEIARSHIVQHGAELL